MERLSPKLFSWASICDDATRKQALRTSTMLFIWPHMALRSDCHLGKGATVGSVIPTKGAIMPAAVGVDIGCGMVAARTSLTANDLPDNLLAVRSAIEAAVPHGRTDNGGPRDRGAWGDVPARVIEAMLAPRGEGGLHARLAQICAKHPKLERSARRAPHHLGTLGTG